MKMKKMKILKIGLGLLSLLLVLVGFTIIEKYSGESIAAGIASAGCLLASAKFMELAVSKKHL